MEVGELSHAESYNPKEMQAAIMKKFMTQMQDAHEFLLYFFDRLSKEETGRR